jgi:hypothetical protein
MATIVSDSFTRAADALLNAHTPDIGQQWTLVISSGGSASMTVLAANDTVGGTASVANTRVIYASKPDPTVNEYDVQFKVITLPVSSTFPYWLMARMVDASNYYAGGSWIGAAANDKQIIKRVTGTASLLASGDTGSAVNDIMTLQVRTGSLTLLKNGVSQATISDSSITAIGQAGIGLGNVGTASADDLNATCRLDDYTVTTIDADGLPLQSRVVASPFNPILFGV